MVKERRGRPCILNAAAFAERPPRCWPIRSLPESVTGQQANSTAIPKARSRWALKNRHPLTKQTGPHVRINVFGAVAPATGACSALIFERCDTNVFKAYLDTLATDAPPVEGKSFHIVLASASWHKSWRLNRHHFTPVHLPPPSSGIDRHVR